MKDYPGLYAGLRELTGGSRPLVKAWMVGNRRPSVEVCERLAAYVLDRAERMRRAGLALQEMAAERRAKPRRASGFCVVDPVTGLDGRSRGGRKGKVKEV